MPTIASRIRARPEPVGAPPLTIPSENPHPYLGRSEVSPTLRSPLPNLSPASPDNLRQSVQNGRIPQYRVVPPGPIQGR
jgi:hypothetical protein